MCEYCDEIVMLDDFGDPLDNEIYLNAIAYSDHEFKIITYDFEFQGHESHFTGMKYCPFCGKELEVPAK